MTRLLVIALLCLVAGVELLELITCEDKECSHECTEEVKGPTCACPEGLVLGPDKLTCQVAVSILMSMFRGITLYSEDTGNLRRVVPVKVNSFDFHFANKEIYTYTNRTIYRFSMDDALQAPRPLVTPRSMPTSLAVDWVHDELFWIGEQRTAIEVISLNGTDHRILVNHNNTAQPAHWHNLVVDPYAKKLFWLGDKHLYNADLDGSNLQFRRIHASTTPLKPDDITLDTQNQLVYIIGDKRTGNKAVVRSRYDGSQAAEVMTIDHPGSEVYGFGVLGKILYWQSDHNGENLYKCEIPKIGEEPKIVLMEELYQVVYDMKVYSPDVQRPQK